MTCKYKEISLIERASAKFEKNATLNNEQVN